MSVETLLMDISINPDCIETEEQLSQCSDTIRNILGGYLVDLNQINSVSFKKGVFKLYSSSASCMTIVRIYKNGQITISIEYCTDDKDKSSLNFTKLKAIEHDIRKNVNGIVRTYSFFPVKRGSCSNYYYSQDNELLYEYDIDDVLFEKYSPYQNVLVVNDKIHGNMLVLDGLVNITESDLLYTESLMARGKVDYKDKEIVILGGGDGALLYELLKEEPKNVIMIDIDEVVIQACNKHMKSICGDVLEKRSGPNFEIIVGDCIDSLNDYVKNGKKFDYIFSDLTDIPVSESPDSELTDFTTKVLDLSFKVLKETGKFMTHSTSWEGAVEMMESELAKLDRPTVIDKTEVLIPSFMENWMFYQVSFKQ